MNVLLAIALLVTSSLAHPPYGNYECRYGDQGHVHGGHGGIGVYDAGAGVGYGGYGGYGGVVGRGYGGYEGYGFIRHGYYPYYPFN
ncbi:hypothetical protein ACF0H5_013117 [Mactra antiquata]